MVEKARGSAGRSVDTLWEPMPRLGRPVRTARVVLGLAGGVALANLLAIGTVVALAPSSATPARTRTVAAPANHPARAAELPHGTPADRVVAALVATDLLPTLGSGWSSGRVSPGSTRPPLAALCRHPEPLTDVFTGAGRDLTGPGAGARLQVWAFGAGQAVAAESALRQAVQGCPGVSVSEAPGVSQGTGGGFTAQRGSGSQWVGWTVRRRGDTLVSLTATAAAPAAWLDPATVVLDRRLDSLLRGSCADQSEQPSDALTNPYAAGAAYQPHRSAVAVSGPTYAAPPEPAPEAPLTVTLPSPSPHPELAPPVLAPQSQWLDTNHDGVPDTPVPLAQAQRGAAPVYVDPQLLRVPDGLVTVPPTEPARPTAPTSMTAGTPTPDPVGPGCGWAFTGQAPPHEDTALLARQAQVAIAQTMVTLAAAQAAYQVEVVRWSRLESAYHVAHAKFVAYQTITQALHDAMAQQAQAQAAYASAVTTYEQALAGAAQSPTSPSPSSTTTAPPATPTTSAP